VLERAIDVAVPRISGVTDAALPADEDGVQLAYRREDVS